MHVEARWEYCDVLPPLNAEDLARLRNSIAAIGVLHPIVVDEGGVVIDGRHRLTIAEELGVDCPRIVRPGLSADDKLVLAVELNVPNRQLTDAQKMLLAERIWPAIAARADARHKEGLKRGVDAPVVDGRPERGRGTTRGEVARIVGIGSGRTLNALSKRMDNVRTRAPELLPGLESGELTLESFMVRERLAAPRGSRPDASPRPRAGKDSVEAKRREGEELVTGWRTVNDDLERSLDYLEDVRDAFNSKRTLNRLEDAREVANELVRTRRLNRRVTEVLNGIRDRQLKKIQRESWETAVQFRAAVMMGEDHRDGALARASEPVSGVGETEVTGPSEP